MLHTRAKPSHLLLAGLLYAFFAIFLVWPVLQVVGTGFRARGTGGSALAYVSLIFRDPALRLGMFRAVEVAVAVTLMCVLIALPLAVLSVRYEFRGRGVLTGLLLVPLVLPPFVGAVGMQSVLARLGPLSILLGAGRGTGIDWLGTDRYKLIGIVIVEALHFYPILLLNLQ